MTMTHYVTTEFHFKDKKLTFAQVSNERVLAQSIEHSLEVSIVALQQLLMRLAWDRISADKDIIDVGTCAVPHRL